MTSDPFAPGPGPWLMGAAGVLVGVRSWHRWLTPRVSSWRRRRDHVMFRDIERRRRAALAIDKRRG